MSYSYFLKSASVCALAAASVGVANAADDALGADEVIVTATPLDKTAAEIVGGVTVLTGDDLQRNLAASIGETLRGEPGVSSTFFGPGASRPVIRGLGGARIRVLDAGIGSIDASSTSVDHAVAVDPALAERIEVVRGTGMLRYGSSAAGGVVNVFDGRIPNAVPEGGIDLAGRYARTTVDEGDEAAGAITLDLGEYNGVNIVVHGDGVWRETDDYDIPGFSESAAFIAAEEAEEGDDDEEGEEEAFGVVENSDIRTVGFSGGFSFIFNNGFIGFSGKRFETDYGIPGGHEHAHEEEEGEDEEEEGEEEVRIDLEQTRYDMMGEFETDIAIFSKATFRVGYADYEHKEFEGPGEVGTVFSNEGWEGRFELIERENNGWGGALGFQFQLRDFAAIGEEAFVPPTETTSYGVFYVKQYKTGPWGFDVGARYENTKHDVSATPVERDFNTFSVSADALYQFNEVLSAGATVFRTERAPSTEELFSNGPHLATNQFEIGDPDLDKEIAIGVEGSVKASTERFSGAFNVFYTSYEDFIYETATGAEEDELPVFAFLAADATFRGFEVEAAALAAQTGPFDIVVDGQLSYVRATQDGAGDEDLPRIPPLSGIVGFEATSTFFDVRAEAEIVGEQDDVSSFELPTDGYELYNLYATVRPFKEAPGVALEFSGLNLADEEARQHVSFLKDLLPLPGRNYRIAIRGAF
ncbi:MAG: TonB-dependent receptor [Pseudomonadota bacterium]